MKRTAFTVLYIIIVSFGYKTASSQSKQPSSRPNVLFIVTDDMNAWSVHDNYPVLKTPAIDKLVSQSYNFFNATCTAPVCIPSRASFFSGRYPHHTGA